ncbi:Lrp/AsnC ligand binding domain-containing protein [Candidatus Njordibacter sp. Uisw_039]|jgi:Lrp/AsnC family leucine-responsive transcriptional regulator|uniref:Lrp/AsnC family transcriptional regulator n=1 Tax=Candidatus Njordibacter sp. Uisw_039 TaxID=3230972 RepID=UPI003A20A096|tara:strand:+ start:4757 stop:5203 length:447 start_codon:yes stop_codon:yes gene_type:complete
MNKLDRHDQAIIAALQKDGRMTITALAEHVGLSNTPCQIRLKRLQDQGYITGYIALVNKTKLGLDHVAFVQATLASTSSKALAAFNAAVATIVEIEQCHMTAASFDYLLKVRTKDMASYRAVLGEKISSLPHVVQTSTFVVMESVKDV